MLRHDFWGPSGSRSGHGRSTFLHSGDKPLLAGAGQNALFGIAQEQGEAIEADVGVDAESPGGQQGSTLVT